MLTCTSCTNPNLPKKNLLQNRYARMHTPRLCMHACSPKPHAFLTKPRSQCGLDELACICILPLCLSCQNSRKKMPFQLAGMRCSFAYSVLMQCFTHVVRFAMSCRVENVLLRGSSPPERLRPSTSGNVPKVLAQASLGRTKHSIGARPPSCMVPVVPCNNT